MTYIWIYIYTCKILIISIFFFLNYKLYHWEKIWLDSLSVFIMVHAYKKVHLEVQEQEMSRKKIHPTVVHERNAYIKSLQSPYLHHVISCFRNHTHDMESFFEAVCGFPCSFCILKYVLVNTSRQSLILGLIPTHRSLPTVNIMLLWGTKECK